MSGMIIELRDVRKDYHLDGTDVHAVRGVSFEVPRGSFVAIRGASGSGKSTLLSVLGLLAVPDGGLYRLDGRDVTTCTDAERAEIRNHQIGFVFQQFHLLPRISVLENVALPAVYCSGRPDHSRARECLAAVGMADYTMRLPNQLSGGQQQRVAIARALMNNPQLVLADEPTGNLDSESAESVLTALSELNRRGATILMVTHEPDVARRAEREIEMRDGLICRDSSREAVGRMAVPVQPGRAAVEQRSTVGLLATHAVQAWRSLAAHAFRSLLSMLGVMVGTFAVMMTVVLIAGARSSVQLQLETLGTNLLIVSPTREQADVRETNITLRLSTADAEVARRVPGVRAAAPVVLGRADLSVVGEQSVPTPVVGTEAAFADLTANRPVSGRFFTQEEVDRRARVVVLGATPSRRLFGGQDPVGRSLRVNDLDFRVLGTLPERGLNPWKDPDDVVVIPITTAMRQVLGRQDVDQLQIEVISREAMPDTEANLRAILEKRHAAAMFTGDTLRIRNLSRIRRAFEQISSILSTLLVSVSIVTLLVGGIGIMNIMLVAVTERTREVGLRKALGARREDIMLQFVMEAGLLSTAGGAAGVCLGLAVISIMGGLGDPGYATQSAGTAAFTAAVLTGLVFGLWPAWRAALRDPVESLRHE